ncbi:hypothetical protein SDC9_205624 [bioreactor metagenome]|uniref:Uncharacterized protein n=1 Tax=bioreactor metagenome TaxID=1076179 RepID=A0A645J2K7_9ZZZZ
MQPFGHARGTVTQDEQGRSGDEQEDQDAVVEPGIEAADLGQTFVQADVGGGSKQDDDQYAQTNEQRQVQGQLVLVVQSGG